LSSSPVCIEPISTRFGNVMLPRVRGLNRCGYSTPDLLWLRKRCEDVVGKFVELLSGRTEQRAPGPDALEEHV
jgi:hypothetical protein